MRRVDDERITMLPGAPAIYQTILDHPDLDRFDLSSLRLAVTGAATVPVEMIRRMVSELTFTTIVTGYGLTEATGVVTMCRHTDDPETIAHTAGRPIPDIEVRTVDEAGKDVPVGDPGEVVVRGYNLMAGYIGDPDASAAAIDADGWLHTGDIGVFDGDGNLKITDRLKDMFIVGGFNAYPAEIENMMTEHPAVGQAAVVGVPDRRMGEVATAFVVPRAGATIDEAGLIAWCREQDGQLQGAALGPGGRRPPAERQRQGPQVRPARAGGLPRGRANARPWRERPAAVGGRSRGHRNTHTVEVSYPGGYLVASRWTVLKLRTVAGTEPSAFSKTGTPSVESAMRPRMCQ